MLFSALSSGVPQLSVASGLCGRPQNEELHGHRLSTGVGGGLESIPLFFGPFVLTCVTVDMCVAKMEQRIRVGM